MEVESPPLGHGGLEDPVRCLGGSAAGEKAEPEGDAVDVGVDGEGRQPAGEEEDAGAGLWADAVKT
jgi:hypothetical protein